MARPRRQPAEPAQQSVEEIEVYCTPYVHLQDGDEFIQIGGRAVLLKDIEGTRTEDYRFIPAVFPRRFHIRVMRKIHGRLIETIAGMEYWLSRYSTEEVKEVEEAKAA